MNEEDLDEAALESMIERARPHRLVDLIPSPLQPWLLPASWQQGRLWTIQRPVRSVSVEHLRWHYDMPWWRGGDGEWFAVSPREYLENPSAYPEHERRVGNSELSFPLHGVHRRGRIQILDGIHRLVKADVAGQRSMDVILLDLDGVESILDFD